MENTQEQNQQENLNNEVEVEIEGDSYVEQLLKASIKAYENGFNSHNEKLEAKYILTITTHKVARPEGNKDVAYLRLDKHIRTKGSDEVWVPQLVHQEAYVFKNLKERVNPDAHWKEQLFLSCLSRLIGAGLEYAEFLRRAKQIEENRKKESIPTEEERLAKIGLVKAESTPTPLTKEDNEYKEWLNKERAKEGL